MTLRRTLPAVPVVALSALLACATSGPRPGPAGAAASASPLADAATEAGAATLAPDRSLRPKDYVARGLPAVDRSWNAEDLRTAAAVLGAIGTSDPLQLPRRGSRASGAVFARLLSLENFGVGVDAPIPARLQAGGNAETQLAQILGLYLRAHMAGKGSFAPEIVDLSMAAFAATRQLAPLMDAIPRPKDRAAAAKYDAARAQVTDGFGMQAKGLLVMLGDRATLLAADRERLAAFLAQELPPALPFIPKARAELLTLVRSAIADEPSPTVRSRLVTIRQALETKAH